MMRSEEELPIEIGLFYKVWVCDAHLRYGRCRENKHACINLKAVVHSNAAHSHLSRALGQSHSEQREVLQHLTADGTAAHLEETKEKKENAVSFGP